jgi:hypothetical protein
MPPYPALSCLYPFIFRLLAMDDETKEMISSELTDTKLSVPPDESEKPGRADDGRTSEDLERGNTTPILVRPHLYPRN